MPRLITPDEIRPLLGNLSRNNYYEFYFGGLSSSLLNYVSRRGVDVSFISRSMGLLCDSASLPGSSSATIESNNFTGVTQNFAHTPIYTPINLSFYVDDEYRALTFLNHWMEFIYSGNPTGTSNQYYSNAYNVRLQYPNDYKTDGCKIYKFEKDFKRIYEYGFIGLQPKDLSSTEVAYGPTNTITKVNCSFIYDRYIPGSTYSFDVVRNLGNNLNNTLDSIIGGIGLLDRFLNF